MTYYMKDACKKLMGAFSTSAQYSSANEKW